MQKLFAVEIVIGMLILFFIKGQSLRCYICRSDIDEGCDENLNQSLTEECPKRENFSTLVCRKINQKVKFKNEKDWTVIRECGYEKQSHDCYSFKWVNLGYQETCECVEETCNGGSGLIPNIMAVVVLFFLLGMINYLNCDNT